VIEIIKIIKSLCNNYNLPVPIIKEAYKGDPCDVTSPNEIRLKLYKNDNIDYHAKHVFCHWLCNMENTEYSDIVVDIIVELLNKED
jgi:hypothetical protein